MTEWDADAVRARLREGAALDPGCERFGADTHRYALSAAPGEAEVRAFEEAHGVRLPLEYRSFVVDVGDGPAGPGHGLMPLALARPGADDAYGWAVDDEWATDRLPGTAGRAVPARRTPAGCAGRPWWRTGR
ncbi:SMI1/KNR4 family protein [Streptomyces sp. LHD-70]|uniref:SMI1/KNR4 family protein n=1 Tax=Streptomyces sp. LHD-70 TaxID=3072140 RepID=UPI00280F1866|nr:SMI1/KNR4 family protein [Streptomyces sp. LHD-70]MDQ8705209.1 SMI1/KNR4 family protein [Streptomyces sp. LHD-70]